MKTRHLIWGLIILIVAVAGCGTRKDTVAKVGSEYITVDDFKNNFVAKFRGEENAARRSYQDRERAVRELAVSLAKYQEAESRGIDRRPEVQEQIEKIARRKSLDLLYEAKVVNAVITDAAAKDFYDKSGMEVKARHILLRTSDTDSTMDSVTVKARIDSIAKALKQGLDFKTAAIQFSQDATSAADSGDLGWFKWGRMVEEFQQAAWKASPGEITAPVRTSYGYHLINVEDKRPIQGRTSFEESKDQIKQQLRQVESGKMMDVARKYVEDLREKNKLKLNDENITIFRNRVLDPTVSKTSELGPNFTDEQKALVVASYAGGQATVADLIEKIGPNAARVDWNEPQTIIDLVNAIVEPKFLEKDAEDQGYYRKAMNDPDVQAEKRQAVIRLLEKEEITDKINPTEADEKAFYENNLDKFIQPETRTIREIFIKEDSSKAVRVLDRARKGEDFRKLALRFNEKESTKTDTGRIGPFEEKRFGLIGKTAFVLKNVGEVSDIVPIGKNFSIVQLLEIFPSRTKTWEESKAEAKRMCRQSMTEKAQAALDEMVLERYKLDINSAALAAVWPIKDEPAKDKLAREP
ncbi:MAG: peptidylprolyl isomerase [Calditrichota bacterium]